VAEVFSFHATKFVNTFEGGAIVTNDGNLARHLREMRNFGFAEGRDTEVIRLGINAKMPEVSAAMGIRSLDELDRIRTVNRRNAARYREELAGCPGMRMVAPADPDASNCQYVAIEVDESEAGLSRDELLKVLNAEGIIAKAYFAPGCDGAGSYSRATAASTGLPVTEKLATTVLALPQGSRVGESDVERIGRLFRFVIGAAKDLRRGLDGSS
jgi:dTDP-4-amino-4,6-dideoxygalactose transaminase